MNESLSTILDMIATFINILTVLIGSLIGKIFHGRIKESVQDVVYVAIGLVTIVLGISMAMKSSYIIYMLISLIFGGIIGHALDIDGAIFRFGDRAKKRLGNQSEDSSFAKGFLNASILFCAGAMSIVGSIKAGIDGDYQIILIKSVMDGFMAIIFTSVMGLGVALSALVILVYQGGLTLLAGVLEPYLNDLIINEISGTGGVLVLMIGLSLSGIKPVKTANFTPALVLVAVLAFLHPYLMAIAQLWQ